MKFLKLPQIIRVNQIKIELKTIHPDVRVHANFDEEVMLILNTGEDMIAGEFKSGSKTRELMEELELIYT